jgi:uncharacterized membrane protein HdeD (DUF308 family)
MSDAPENSPGLNVAQALGRLWWLPLVRGILLLLLGAYALFRPGMTMIALTQVVGVFIVIDGILSVIAAVIGQVPSRGWVIVRGILEVLVGLFVFANPLIIAGITATVLIYMLGFSAILFGVMEIVAAIQDRKQIEGEGWLILAGVLTVLFGIMLLVAPMAFGLFMVRVLGFFAIISGIVLIVFAFRLRGLGKGLTEQVAE